jgi:hypothetical protein
LALLLKGCSFDPSGLPGRDGGPDAAGDAMPGPDAMSDGGIRPDPPTPSLLVPNGKVVPPPAVVLTLNDTSVPYFRFCHTTAGLATIEDPSLCPGEQITDLPAAVVTFPPNATSHWKAQQCEDAGAANCSDFTSVGDFFSDNSLKARLEFDGNLDDTSGNGNNGASAPANMPTFVASGGTCNGMPVGNVAGMAACFDGNNDLVTVLDANTIDAPQAVRIRVKPGSFATNVGLIDKFDGGVGGPGYFLSLVTGTGRVDWTVNNVNVGFVTVLSPGVWTEIYLTHEMGTQYLYRNGSLVDSAAFAEAVGANNHPLAIGANLNGAMASEFLEGEVDRVYVYSNPHDGEVARILNCTSEAEALNPLPAECFP